MENLFKELYSEFTKKGIEYIEKSDAPYEEKLIALSQLPTITAYVLGQYALRLIYKGRKTT